MVTDHHVTVWLAGYNAFPDSRCKLRKCSDKRNVVEEATTVGVNGVASTSEEGTYNATDMDVYFDISQLPTRGIAMSEDVELLQPQDSTDPKQWKKFRVAAIDRRGDLMIYNLEAVNEQGN